MKTEDTLRQEYTNLLPTMHKMLRNLEIKINWHLKEDIYNLKKYEQIEVTSRVKECESAIQSLKAKTGGGFDSNIEYSLTSLKDLVGVRISVFPNTLLKKIKQIIESQFSLPQWIPDNKNNESSVWQYQFNDQSIGLEIQIIPALLSAFWKIEHAILYKPHPTLKGLSKNQGIKAIYEEILKKLTEFESEIEKHLK